jgi:hypothetical protein
MLPSEKISLEIISNLHSLGFKVVPISPDGVTPCMLWGKIYENGWDESELFKTDFTNVASCFGKSHIKDEKGREVYLNCLDIDSKEVYDRLCIVMDRNRKERFLINQLRNLTYVTKTRKEYGFHIYWLSHRLNMPIQRNNCKPGFEFEIKTDKRSGLAGLPPSRHRDDVDSHYRSIGQNKIMISDSLYGEIVRILDDCLVKEHTPPPYNTASANRKLNERDIEKILDCLSGLYVKGFRHEMCYAISGIMYKNGIGLETTSKIINELGRHDEELKSRLAVMRHTYSKDASEVSGRKQLLQTLKSVCNDDKRAVKLLLSILRILNHSVYEPVKIEHNKVAEELMEGISLPSTLSESQLEYLKTRYKMSLEFITGYNPKLLIFNGKIWYVLLIMNNLIESYKRMEISTKFGIYFYKLNDIPCVLFDRFFQSHFSRISNHERYVTIPNCIHNHYQDLSTNLPVQN